MFLVPPTLTQAEVDWTCELVRRVMGVAVTGDRALLVIDEIQKVANWPETIKALWQTQPERLRVLLLGSSALQIQAGVTESLAVRFELLRVHHWSFADLQTSFDDDLSRNLAFGGLVA